MQDLSDRIIKINEVLVALSEQQFTARGTWKAVPEKPERPIDPYTDKPKGVNRSAPPSQRTPEDNDFLTKQREYNLQNQQGRQNFNPNAPQQMYTPSWNVKGEERRQQMRAYLNYIRADPERLAKYRAQYNDRETRPVASFAGRPESEVQARLAAYNRGAALSRAGSIGMHSPGLVPGLADAANATYDATMDKLALADLIKKQKSFGQLRAQNVNDRQALENQRRGEVGPSTPGNENFSGGERTRSGVGADRAASIINSLNPMAKIKSLMPPAQSTSVSTPKAPDQSQGAYEFYNRNTGQIERSDAPGVDRVFRDSSGKAYRIEGGSGRKVYI